MNLSLDHPLLLHLGLTLFHALWQVSFLGLLAWTGLFLLRRRSPEIRYAFALAALGAMVALPLATYFLAGPWVPEGPVPDPGPSRLLLDLREHGGGPWFPAALRILGPWAAMAWFAGVAFMILRLGGGLLWLERRLARPSLPGPEVWRARAQELAHRLGITVPFRLLLAEDLDSPLVIGWIRPMILLPAAALLDLPPAALEAVLAHELAHVGRRDYLVNLFQSFAEALLFFHPAAWWLSGHLRVLREHCCDDAAARLLGNPMDLAQGLALLERLRRTSSMDHRRTPEPTLGAAKGNLMSRIERLFRPQDPVLPTFRNLVLPLSVTLLLGACALAAQASNPDRNVRETQFSKVKVVDQPQAPAYPPDAKARRIQGLVVVSVTIDESGSPIDVQPVSGPEELRKTAVDYARSWKFAPFKVKGQPVKARFKLEMPFRLR